MMSKHKIQSSIFNSPLETGIRSVCILTAGFGHEFDLQQLLALDHIVVHSGDIEGGPESLHPDVQQRNAELLIRRPIVQLGLDLMQSKGLIVRSFSTSGIRYSASEFAPIFIDSLENNYIDVLLKRSEWAVQTYKELGSDSFYAVFNAAFDRWATEFQISDISLRRL